MLVFRISQYWHSKCCKWIIKLVGTQSVSLQRTPPGLSRFSFAQLCNAPPPPLLESTSPSNSQNLCLQGSATMDCVAGGFRGGAWKGLEDLFASAPPVDLTALRQQLSDRGGYTGRQLPASAAASKGGFPSFRPQPSFSADGHRVSAEAEPVTYIDTGKILWAILRV